MVTVGQKIAELLDWKGMSQQELAAAVGTSKQVINSYVTGNTAVSVDMAYKIAAALGVTPWSLLNGNALLATHDDLTPDEYAVVACLRGLHQEQSGAVLTLLRYFEEQNRARHDAQASKDGFGRSGKAGRPKISR